MRIVLVAVIAGGAAFLLAKHLGPTPAVDGEVDWLVQEFNLTSSQAAEVQRLHREFQPICERHCDAVREAKATLAAAETAEARQAAEAKLRELESTCHAATREHLQRVAAVMPADEAERYIKLIEPRLSEHQHAEPFGLQ